MQKNSFLKKFFLCGFSVFFVTMVQASNPLNHTCEIKALEAYYQDLSPQSEYMQDVSKALEKPRRYLKDRVEKNRLSKKSEKLAMVLDIDDTSVSNYPANKARGFGNTERDIARNYQAANDPAILPVLKLYNEALQNNVAVFFITMREPFHKDSSKIQKLYEKTKANLLKAGYADWSGLYLPQANELSLSSSAYKTRVRENLTRQGYKIILNIGDQDSDFEGGYAEMTAKIPNYLYSTNPNASCQAS